MPDLFTVPKLYTYLDSVGITSGPFVRSLANPTQGLGSKTLSHYMRKWLNEAGVKIRARDGRSAHGLRRTAASDVMERTGDIRVVQEMLGHSSPDVTARHYLRPVSIDALRTAMEGRSYDEAA